MSDGENKQEFQMEQLEEKHNKDGSGKASDSRSTGSPMLGIGSPYLWLPNPLCASPCVKEHPMRKFFISMVSKASNSLFSLFVSPSMLGVVWELESHLECSAFIRPRKS